MRKRGGDRPIIPTGCFAAVIYAFSRHSGSLRRMEESMQFDTRFMYLMEQKAPSYSTISRFCNNIVVARCREVFSCIMKEVVRKFGIDISDAFVDGTKLEANANKYKFVWRPGKRHDRLNEGLRAIISAYFPLPAGKKEFISKEVAGYLSGLGRKIADAGLAVVNGSGHRQEQIVKDFHSLEKMLLKALEYGEIETVCGPGRNSYYKTDRDATAMCLKQDYYSRLGSSMHAAYSLQILVSKGFVLDFLVSQDRADTRAFIPLLDHYHDNYGRFPERLCADSGYGSLENYRYMAAAGMGNYMKPQTWQKTVGGEYVELYRFDGDGNLFCMDGRKAVACGNGGTHPRGRETRFYLIENCRRCSFKPYCMRAVKDKKHQERVFEACRDLWMFKQEAMRNLLSPKGIEMRVNRSSQVEGAFGVIKQDMDYDRVRRKGLDNVSAECMLVCLGYNIRKLFTFIEGKGRTDYWMAPEGLEPEVPKEPNMEKLIKKLAKKKMAGLKVKYKYRKGTAVKQ